MPPIDVPGLGRDSEAPASSLKPVVVLIEDNPDAAESFALLLEFFGHTVHVAHDGRSGLSLARALQPDAVLCDIGLPDIEGYEVALALRADDALSSTRLIALTGSSLEEDVERAARAGFDTHIAKPADIEKVVRAIREARRAS